MWRYVRNQSEYSLLSVYECPEGRVRATQSRGGDCVSVILCNSDGLAMPDVATIQPTELSPRGETTDAVSPAVISIVTVLLDLDAASLTPGKSRKVLTMQRKRRPLSARKRAPHFLPPERMEACASGRERHMGHATGSDHWPDRNIDKKAARLSFPKRHSG